MAYAMTNRIRNSPREIDVVASIAAAFVMLICTVTAYAQDSSKQLDKFTLAEILEDVRKLAKAAC